MRQQLGLLFGGLARSEGGDGCDSSARAAPGPSLASQAFTSYAATLIATGGVLNYLLLNHLKWI